LSRDLIRTSPQAYARLGGALYLIVILFGAFAEGFVRDRLIVSGDLLSTAHNIVGSQAMWRLAVACDMIVPLLGVVGAWISYVLLRPVSRSLILLNVFFTLMSLAVESVSKVFLFLVLPILTSRSYVDTFQPQELQGLANLAIRSHDITFNIALIYFGVSCILEGYLLYKSGYFPKVIGILMQLAGLSYLASCFAIFFAPGFASVTTPGFQLVAFIGESSYCLWLLIKGVDVAKWNERIGAVNMSANLNA
jgi:hypothetical protein